ncbi:hypothetical protein R1sor_026703 [Riccia sorocarpa]|uniref:CCHC-type domain-containing protein n=1 Tax=Riccia sorocarpa TaxID=122646 RepID=A0ABD3GC70_9MARC
MPPPRDFDLNVAAFPSLSGNAPISSSRGLNGTQVPMAPPRGAAPTNGASGSGSPEHTMGGNGAHHTYAKPFPSWSDKVTGQKPFGGGERERTEQEIELENQLWVEGVTDLHVQTAFNELKWHQPGKPGLNPLKMPLDMEIARRTLGILSKAGLLLFTAEEAPSRDKVIRWVEEVLIQKIGYTNPMIVDQGHKMLAKLGPILYYAVVRTNETKYSHIRGCIMMHNLNNLHDAICLELPWGGEYIQEVEYTGLPDQCHKCRQRGHWAADCSNTPVGRHTMGGGAGTSSAGTARRMETVSPAPASQGDKIGNGFTPVGRKGEKAWRAVEQNSSGAGSNPSTNLYEVLEVEEEDDNEGTQGAAAEQTSPQNQGEEPAVPTDPKITPLDTETGEQQVAEKGETADDEMTEQEEENDGGKNEVSQAGESAEVKDHPVTVQQTARDFDINIATGEEEYQGVETVEFSVESEKNQVVENEHCVRPGVEGELENHQTGREVPTDVELEKEEEHGAGLDQDRQQEEEKERVEAITIVTQVTPERRAVEKRRTLENREPLNLRAEFMDVRSRTRRHPQTGELNFLASFPTTNVGADLSVLIPADLRADEANEWMHRLEPWRGEAITSLLPGWDPFDVQQEDAAQEETVTHDTHGQELLPRDDNAMVGLDEGEEHYTLEMENTGHPLLEELDGEKGAQEECNTI